MDNSETFKELERMFMEDNKDKDQKYNDNYGTLFTAFGIDL